MGKTSTAAKLASLALLTQAACSTSPPAQDPALTQAWEARKVRVLTPSVKWDQARHLITVNLRPLNELIIPKLTARGLTPDAVMLEIDGGERMIPVPLGQNEITYAGPASNRQSDVAVIYLRAGKPVHRTLPENMSAEDFPRVDPGNYANFPLPELILPPSVVARTGLDPSLVPLAAELQHENITWTVLPSANPTLREAFAQRGTALRLSLHFGPDYQVDGVGVTDPADHDRKIPARLDEIAAVGGAAFNWHFFDWDSEFVRRYARFYDPALAQRMLEFKLLTQRPDGSFPREARYDLSSYLHEDSIVLGEHAPNQEYFNPPLLGWAERQAIRWNPERTRAELPTVIRAIHATAQWWRERHGVLQDGKLIGFSWSKVGSGRDNAPRSLDFGGLGVDAISYYKMMLDQEREFDLMLGRWKEADEVKVRADEVAATINREYWDESRGWYLDLAPRNGRYARDPSVTMAGFWPALAGVAPPSQLDRMIAENLENPARFGGGPFPPSVAKDDHGSSLEESGVPLSLDYNPNGQYWRGGGWVPDFVFMGDALLENNRRAEASRWHQRIYAAVAQVSRAYQNGDTPSAAIDHAIPSEEKADLAKHGTFMEFYAVKKDAAGDEIPTWGRKTDLIKHRDYKIRTRFAGWSAAEPLESLRYIFGLDAVPAYAGANAGRSRWLYTLLTDPLFRFHQVRRIPALKPVNEFLATAPGGDYPSFAKFLKRALAKDARLQNQVARIYEGYLELSPTLDPEKGTEIRKITYRGARIDVKLEKLSNPPRVRLTINSAVKIPVQLNQNWTGSGETSHPVDSALAASPVVELGSGTSVELETH